ncbi:MAG: type IV secretory system conjugative DNA transfer family protein [Erythrobacter sp.]|uniref:type IV secretory system conjugative DNA transfer family protein n=1 Tax=Erythrobacter sp. TaxID=1042 RepID=UPI002626B67B|nr:type IV secretory system conjugative DNA transfer family protein [Erythrobacter sp.]MDJ0977262.1 type IV secretory system conjugative DNA transfer family protein [Erythrobacter sp.]
MVWRVGARVHAFTHGLFGSSELDETKRLYYEVAATLEEKSLGSDTARLRLAQVIAEDVCDGFSIPQGRPQAEIVLYLICGLFSGDDLFVLPDVDWSRTRTIAELWDIREEVSRQRTLLDNFEENCGLLARAARAFVAPIYEACPALLEQSGNEDGIAIPTDLLRSLGNVAEPVKAMLGVGFAEELLDAGLLTQLAGRLHRNLIAASGGNPADPEGFKRAPKWPEQSDAKTPEDLVGVYLGGTPLADLFNQKLTFTIPTKSRFEHQHIVAGSGHGKTQTLQYLIAQDLEAMSQEKRSLIVLDSQGDLIKNIAKLDVFGPGGALEDRLVLIDPTDVEYPVSLNLFDVGQKRLDGYEPLERERLTNSILELYDFVLGTLLDAQMTQKQNVIFRYVTRLMLHIPDATIHTLRELMEPGSEVRFAEHIAKLEGTAKHFFETEFASREFEQTKKQVLRRLWGILENQTFERMFSHPRSKLDLFEEMNAGKVILINTAKDLLKEQGTEIFGRFFIAMIAQAAQERSVLHPSKRIPTMVYIDEAQDYFDRNIGLILAQARKYNVGMVLAHQYLGQLEPKLQEAFAANTAIKFAGGVSAKDARSLAPMLYTDPAFIEAQGKGSFAAHIRGVTKHAVPLSFPFGHMEDLPVMSEWDREALRGTMRRRYAVHHSMVRKDDAEDDSGAGGDGGPDAPEGGGPPSSPKSPPPKPPSPDPGRRPLSSGGGSTQKPAPPVPPTKNSESDAPRRPGDVDTTPGETW